MLLDLNRRSVQRGLPVTCAMMIGFASATARGQCDPQELIDLTASDATTGDFFGATVALSGDTAVVGAAHDAHSGGNFTGSAYVFVRSGPPGRKFWTQQAKLTASDAAPADFFGYSVAVWGDTAVIGAHLDDHPGGNDAGAVYVFVKPPGGWIDMTETAKLTASDAAATDLFGVSVAVSGDTVAIGAVQDDHAGGIDAGSAYIFVRPPPGWIDMTETATLTASDATALDRFGTSIALSADTALIGARLDDDGGNASGSAYVFVRSGRPGREVWNQQAKLTASDAAANDEFGQPVAVDGDTAVVGAHSNDDACPGNPSCNSGSAYVFVRSGPPGSEVWSQQAKLTASDAALGDLFGLSVAVLGDTAVIGAWREDNAGGTDAGSAYVFGRMGAPGREVWTQQNKLTASDAAAFDQFGVSVAISGSTLLVGADANDQPNQFNAGSAYVFDLSASCPQDIAPSGESGDCAVNIDDLLAIITAWGPCTDPCPQTTTCAEDIDGDCDVDVDDLLAVINAWGDCP